MASILVTGGAGFIGSHVAEAFLRRGDSVSILDNFNPFYDPALKRRNVETLAAYPGFRAFEGDIRDAGRVVDVMRDARPDGVVHLAAMAGVRPSIEQPALYADVNVMGTMRVLEAAREAGVARFVFASSSSVYGNREGEPFRETDNVDHPVSPYAATKKSGELLCHSWHHLSGIPVTCLRFFTVYGPRQRPDLAIHKFAGLMRRGEAVTVFGDGSTRRDYTFVDDIVDGVVRAFDRANGYRIYNLGGSATIALRDMVDGLAAALGVVPRVVHAPEQPGDVRMTYADVSAARRDLGFSPSVPFAEGIRKFARWHVEAVR